MSTDHYNVIRIIQYSSRLLLCRCRMREISSARRRMTLDVRKHVFPSQHDILLSLEKMVPEHILAGPFSAIAAPRIFPPLLIILRLSGGTDQAGARLVRRGARCTSL